MRYNVFLLLLGWVAFLFAVLQPTLVLGKPAGGGGGGRGGGGSSGGGGRGSSSSSSGGRSSGSSSSSPSSGSRGGAPPPYSPSGPPPPYSPAGSSPGGLKGGSIPRTSPGSSIGSGYRTSGTSSVPRTFGGTYSSSSGSGYLGSGSGYVGSGPFRPRPYWIAVIPFYAWAGSAAYHGGYLGAYCGFSCRYYSRYSDQQGNYYARVVDPIATNSTTGAVSIATVKNTDAASDNRMQWVFGNGTIRSIYYDTSDPQVARTQPADFTFGMALYQFVEYTDTDANGFYSPGDAVVRSVDLTQGWSPLVFAEKAAADGRKYFEGTIQFSAAPTTVNTTANTAAPVAANSTTTTTAAGAATFALTIRSSNVLINDTAPGIIVLPNSVGLDLAITNYAFAAPTNKLALITLLSSAEVFGQDPDLNVTNDGNVTKGVQFGDKAGGRIEWFTSTPGRGSTTGSRVVFPLPSPLPAPGPEDARVTAGRAETAYVQAINVVPGTTDAAAPIRVSMISFLDEQVLTPFSSDGVRADVGMILAVVSTLFALMF
ncbi:hypothetical protein HDU87_001930 [Geranomyces variabilis]|uniref:Uncharacterized protein n=1 Tax=Geranomyces variabilis TaxID=109894 RepID=A0AAD5TRP3_9FUNG|nr:hypothetical protein HDU87_001930 [Geranomyces variabilis]